MKLKTWTELKAILAVNSFFHNYDDKFFKDNPDFGEREVISRRNSDTVYEAFIPIVKVTKDEYTNSEHADYAKYNDQRDYDDNWAAKAGTGDYLEDSWSKTMDYTIPGGIDTLDILLKDAQATPANTESFLFKGKISVDSKARRGDEISIIAIDKDNVLGQGANYILVTLVKKNILLGGAQVILIQPPDTDEVSGKKRIPKDIYVRIALKFKEGATDNVNIIVDAAYYALGN